MRRLRLILSVLFGITFGTMSPLLFLSSCAEEEKAEKPGVSSAETEAAKPTPPTEAAVDIEAEKSAILKMFDAHSAAVNKNRPKGKKNFEEIFQHWIQDNNKNVAVYFIVTFGAPEEISAETWPEVKKLWETILTSDGPRDVFIFQNQEYVAKLSTVVVKGNRASGVGSGKWGAGQTIPEGKLVALFTKRGGNWYIQALEMNASPINTRLKPLQP